MESIRDIALTFCATSVFAAALTLVNGRTLEKSGRYIIALVMLCSVIGSLLRADFDLSLPASTVSQEESNSDITFSTYQAEYLIRDILKERGIKFEKVSAKATKNENGSIVINEITIEGADDREGAASAISSTGIDCRVVFG